MRFIIFLFLFSCSTKIPRPIVSTQKKLPDLSLWEKDIANEKLSLVVNNFYLRKDRREYLKNFFPLGINTRKALSLVNNPDVFYKDLTLKGYLKRCERLISSSCYYVGKKFLEKRKLVDAYKFLQRGCNLNDSESCFLAGVMEYNKKREKSAKYFFEKSCALYSKNGCYFQQLYFTKISEMDTDDLIDFFEFNCDRGNKQSCSNYYFTKIKEGESDDEASDLDELDKLCSEGIGESCYYLSYFYDRKGMEFIEKTTEYIRQSCLKNDAQGCFELVRNGQGLADHRKVLLKKSLELGFNKWEIVELDPALDWIKKDRNVREMIDVYVMRGPR